MEYITPILRQKLTVLISLFTVGNDFIFAPLKILKIEAIPDESPMANLFYNSSTYKQVTSDFESSE
jgi:hypothetical protein